MTYEGGAIRMTAQALGHQTGPENRSTQSPATGNRPRNAITANCCGAWWTGLSAAHCAACHETFTGITAFDLHRRDGECLTPASIGLVPANRDWAGWQMPGSWTGPDE